MAQLQRSDIMKLAELSCLKLSDQEIDTLLTDLQKLISYVDQLSDAHATAQAPTHKATNVMRPDHIEPFPADVVLAQAPERFEHYFVVPKVLDTTKGS